MMGMGALLQTLTWDKGSIVKHRASSSLRFVVNYASLPGPLLLPVWPCSVDILLEFTSFLAKLRWPRGAADLGKLGISFFLSPIL